jgi:hypothetical protein
MRALTLSLSLLACALGSTASAQAVQFDPADPRMQVASDGSTKILLMGPYTIPAGRVLGGVMVPGEFEQNVPGPNPGDVWMTGYDSRIVDTNRVQQDPANLYLHHAVLCRRPGSGSVTDMGCALFGPIVGERFAAAGAERIPFALPKGYGYRIFANDTITGIMHIQNFTTTPRVCYYQFTMTVQPGSAQMNPVRPWWLDVVLCTSSYSVPTGTGLHTKTGDFTAPNKLTILTMGPHLHCGGTKLELLDKNNGNAVMQTFSNTNASLCPVGLDSVLPPVPVVIPSGKVVTLKATYQQSPTKSLDAMGILLCYVIVG